MAVERCSLQSIVIAVKVISKNETSCWAVSLKENEYVSIVGKKDQNTQQKSFDMLGRRR